MECGTQQCFSTCGRLHWLSLALDGTIQLQHTMTASQLCTSRPACTSEALICWVQCRQSSVFVLSPMLADLTQSGSRVVCLLHCCERYHLAALVPTHFYGTSPCQQTPSGPQSSPVVADNSKQYHHVTTAGHCLGFAVTTTSNTTTVHTPLMSVLDCIGSTMVRHALTSGRILLGSYLLKAHTQAYQ